MTEKEYNSNKIELELSVNLFKKIQVKYSLIFNNEDNSEDVKQRYGNLWNDAEDAIYILEEELKDLEHQWETRNWNGNDWEQYKLVCNNID